MINIGYSASEKAIIAADSVIGLEYKHKKLLFSKFSSPEKIFIDERITEQIIFSLFEPSLANLITGSFKKEYIEYILKKYDKLGVTIITYLSKDYPEELKNVDSPPFCLYCNGNTELLQSEKKFAIVGSRKCPADVNLLTASVSGELSENGVTVVTGSAGGADSSAIEGALASGNIISVLAGGYSFVYPAYNKRLIDKVRDNGLVISEHQPSTPTKPWMFPVRNRIIAGLCSGVLITGGSRESGARHTANFALEYGREVFAFPYSLGITAGELPNSLIKAGAYLCEGAADILDYLGINKNREKHNDTELDEDEKRVYELIRAGIAGTDEILNELKIEMYELAPVLSMLELDGLIVKLAGNKYKAVGK